MDRQILGKMSTVMGLDQRVVYSREYSGVSVSEREIKEGSVRTARMQHAMWKRRNIVIRVWVQRHRERLGTYA